MNFRLKKVSKSAGRVKRQKTKKPHSPECKFLKGAANSQRSLFTFVKKIHLCHHTVSLLVTGYYTTSNQFDLRANRGSLPLELPACIDVCSVTRLSIKPGYHGRCISHLSDSCLSAYPALWLQLAKLGQVKKMHG